jgi:2-C-methyl-D-erythritol 4-phosphate cytidylyltransferase
MGAARKEKQIPRKRRGVDVGDFRIPHKMTAKSLPLPGTPASPPLCHALIPSAGSGSRTGLGRPKQYEVLAGRRILDHTLAAFLAVPSLASVTVVVAPDGAPDRVPDLAHGEHFPGPVQVLAVGGATRAESVFNGLSALLARGTGPDDWVLVHDAARCLVTPAQIQALMTACLKDAVGGLLALPLPDTLKVSSTLSNDGTVRIRHTLERGDKWLAQTPQMFRLGLLHRALQQAAASGFAGVTDEASAIEALGLAPLLVPGSAQNVKVTYPEDLALAEAVLLYRQGQAQEAQVRHLTANASFSAQVSTATATSTSSLPTTEPAP